MRNKPPDRTAQAEKQTRRLKVWVAFVRGVGAEHVALVQRYGFMPTKKAGLFWKRFDSLEHAEHAVRPFKDAGLHGVIQNKWREVLIRTSPRLSSKYVAEEESRQIARLRSADDALRRAERVAHQHQRGRGFSA